MPGWGGGGGECTGTGAATLVGGGGAECQGGAGGGGEFMGAGAGALVGGGEAPGLHVRMLGMHNVDSGLNVALLATAYWSGGPVWPRHCCVCAGALVGGGGGGGT